MKTSICLHTPMACLHGRLRPFTSTRPLGLKRSTTLSTCLPSPRQGPRYCRSDRHHCSTHRQSVCKFSLLDQAWGTHVNAQELATNIFSTSIFPYSAFLYFLTKSKKTPPLALFGFYFLLVFVFATIPAGVIALKVYHKSLANVDFLHGSAESMLTLTNLFIVLGLRQGIKQAEMANGTGTLDKQRGADAAQSLDAK